MHGAFYQIRWRDQEEETGRARSALNLPKNLRLHHDSTNPWKRSSFEEDFILISEFAENEGPRAVMTIPSDGGGSFDKNGFALHVMSVDFQSQNKNSDFAIQEDTQLLLTEKKTGTCAFVHHFTLYDIHARGYVRPFCMSYIAHSKRKILSCLDSIMKEFHKIAKLFHFSNRVVFSGDLEQRLVNLLSLNEECQNRRYARSKSKDNNEEANKKKEFFDQTWKDTKKVIAALKPHMIDSRIIDKFKKIEALAESRGRSFKFDSTSPDKQEHIFAEHTGSRSPLKRVRSLSSLEELKALASPGEIKGEAEDITFAPAYLRSLHQLRHLHELCGWGAKEGISRLRNVASYFSQEDIAIAVEKTESPLVEPLPSLLTLGKSVVLNFMHDVDLRKSAKHCEKACANHLFLAALHRRLSMVSTASFCSTDSFKSCLEDDNISSERSSDSVLSPFTPSASFHAELHNEENDTYDSDTTPETPSSDFIALRFDSGHHDDVSLGDFDIIDEENVLKRQLSVMEISQNAETRAGSFTRKSYSLENLPSMSRSLSERRVHDNELKTRLLRPPKQPYLSRAWLLSTELHLGTGVSSTKTPASISEGDEDHVTRGEKKHFNFTRVFNKKFRNEHESGKLSPKRPLHHPRYEKVLLRCYAEEVCKLSDGPYVVSGILEFRNHYSFGVHLVYALLIGRPVIIMAEAHNEKEVRFLVSTLWMFILEHNSYGRAVIPWRKKPLHISDLPCLRLAGLCKSRRCVLPKSVKRYVSILDFETGTIISPPYKGIFLSSVFNYRNCWPSNTTLLAFIHSVLLELACKAYVYYYSYSIGANYVTCAEGSAQPVERGTKSTMEDIEVLTRLGVHFSDATIVQYFAEVVKQQQINSQFHGNEELKAQTIIADLSKCLKYENLAPLNL